MTNGNHAAQSKHLESLATAAKRYVLREILEVATAASSELESLSGGENILDTVPANSNGALWYELENNLPIIKCRLGDTSRIIPYRSRKPVGVPENCIVYLPFDTSVTEDYCGNTWTATGSPSIGSTNAHSENALQLNGSSYLKMTGSVTLGGQDFTICGWACMNSSSSTTTRIFQLATKASDHGTTNFIALIRASNSTLRLYLPAANNTTGSLSLNSPFHFAIVYQHSAASTSLYINGVKAFSRSGTLAQKTWSYVYIGDTGSLARCWKGQIDEFQIYDGVALYTENFTPE